MKQSFSAEKVSQRSRPLHKDKLALNNSIEFPKISEQKLPNIKQSFFVSLFYISCEIIQKNRKQQKKPMFSYNKKQVINYEPKRQDKKNFITRIHWFHVKVETL